MLSNLLQKSMPISEGKKVENITAKVNAQQKNLFQEICDKEDRPISYVVRELALRGLAQYMQDGKLKLTEDEEKVFTERIINSQLPPLQMIQVDSGGKVNEKETKNKRKKVA